MRLLHSCVHFSPSAIVVAAPSSSASVSTVVALSALDSSCGKMLSRRPCMLRTYTSILQMLHSFHRILGVSTSVCVLMLGRPLLMLLLLAILCHVPLPCLLSRVPHAMFSWDQALFLCACCLSVCFLLGCYPVLLQGKLLSARLVLSLERPSAEVDALHVALSGSEQQPYGK